MYKRKLFLLIMIIIVLSILACCSRQLTDTIPKAEAGVIDLTQFQLRNNVVQLSGEWEFYWKQLIKPSELEDGEMTGYTNIPSSWNKYITNEKDDSGDGYSTYRLVFRTGESERLAIKIPRLFTAYKLWINGELKASAGRVGETRNEMIPQYLPQYVSFEAQKEENEIVIQVSNFHHRSGGILENILIGGEKQVLDLRYKGIANEIFLLGTLIALGGYHLALFLFRRKNLSPLYFGLFCILVGIRTMLVGENFFIYLFPAFSWEVAHKIQTLTFYIGVPLILMFFISVFPKYFHKLVVKMTQFIGVIFGILVIFTPARIFTVVNPLYQVWTIVIIIYVLVILLKILINKERGSILISLGAIFLLLTSLNDIVFLSIWRNDVGISILKTIFRIGNLSSAGQFIFAFTNSLLLAKNFSYYVEQGEVMTAELKEINTNLDRLVLQRTKALAESTEKIEHQKLELEKVNKELMRLSLKDPLTGVWNRRKYDEAVELEWHRCLRHQRSIALLLLDIDYFKLLNDTYGHITGDKSLVKIGGIIKESLTRSTDIVARYGGEEFVVLLTDTGKEEAKKIANMLRQKIETLKIPHRESSVSKYVTVSIGVTSTIPDISSSHEELLKTADIALYQAKSCGRNQVKYLPEL